MKLKLHFLFLILLISACAIAQPGTKNKQAQKKFGEALFHFNSFEYEKALERAEEAISSDKKFADAYMLKGDILRALKRYDEAIQSFNTAAALAPDYAPVFILKGSACFEGMHYDEALEALNKFVGMKGASADQKKEAQRLIRSAEFAKEAIKHPVPFKPINMGANINSAADEYFPGLTTDEQTLYFTRQQGMNEDFYASRKLDTQWQRSYDLGAPVNTPRNEGFVSVTTDGQYLFFTACNRPESKGSCDLYFTRLDGDRWTKPVNMPKPVNSAAWESQPAISFDGTSLYFASNRPGGYGGIDIWVSVLNDGMFGEPKNLGPNINTEFDDQSPFLHQDGKTLYFSSKGLPGFGNGDIFMSRIQENGEWGKAENLGYPINTNADEFGFIVNRKGDMGYFASRMPGGFGGVDIYCFELPKTARPDAVSYAKGVVLDDETGAKLQANVELNDLAKAKTLVNMQSNPKTGEFLIVLQPHRDYGLNVNLDGYLFHSENFALKENPSDDPFLLTVRLKKIKKDVPVEMKNVFFDVDKFDLKPESFIELDKLAALLEKQPKMKIQLSGHTDNTGDKQKNLTLSQNRAKAVYQYLVDVKKIDKTRLTYKGYGDTKPKADNSTPEGRKQNRRTEFTVTEF